MRSTGQNLRFLDDLAKMASGAVGSLGDVRGYIKSAVTALLGEMDIVSRAEFERVEALAEKARERQVELEKRLAALEKKKPVAAAAVKKAKTAPVKKAAKKPTPSKKKKGSTKK